jgi:hypothetical protein
MPGGSPSTPPAPQMVIGALWLCAADSAGASAWRSAKSCAVSGHQRRLTAVSAIRQGRTEARLEACDALGRGGRELLRGVRFGSGRRQAAP